MKARVTVTLKPSVLDPQGKAIEGALRSLDLKGVASVRQGKMFDIEIDAEDAPPRARRWAKRARGCSPTRSSRITRSSLPKRCAPPSSSFPAPIARATPRARSGRRPAARRRSSGTTRRRSPPGTDLVVLPGGFSYGDYLRCGAIAARARIMDAVRAHAERGGLVLGICNGFQILCEAGLLPGVLMRNADRRFVCRMQHLRVEIDRLAASRALSPGPGGQIRHRPWRGQLRRRRRDDRRARGRGARRLPLLRRRGRGRRAAPIPTARPTPSPACYNERFNVLGLMPHPENLIDPLVGGVDGRPLFAGLAA